MKKSSIFIAMTVSLAVLSAYAGNASTKNLANDSEEQLVNGCFEVESGCSLSGTRDCLTTEYKIPQGSESHCSIPLTKRP